MSKPQEPGTRDLVVYALSTMGSMSERHHTEAVAIRCHELSPTRFSWTTRPDIPDKDIVRVALTNARKEMFGALVEGRTGLGRGLYQHTKRGPMSDGWKLTEAGQKWIEANRHRFENVSKTAFQKDHRQQSRKSLKRIREHDLFNDFIVAPDAFAPGIGQLGELVRCRVDAESVVWHKRFQRLRELAIETDQPDIQKFIEACKTAYEQLKELG